METLKCVDGQAVAEANARTPLETARWLLDEFGIYCINFARLKKHPVEDGWERVRAKDDDLTARFYKPTNMGVLLGEASNNLADIDLDCDEAVALAEWFLPATGLAWGRPKKQAQPTHRLYRVKPEDGVTPQPRLKYEYRKPPVAQDSTDAKKYTKSEMLLELRYAGHQSMCAPSVHPDGDTLAWMAVSGPAEVTYTELQKACAKIALATLVVRNWPGPESRTRHDYVMSLAGVFARRNLPEDDALQVIAAAGEVAGDGDPHDRADAVRGTYQKHEAKGSVTGIPTLKELLSEADVKLLETWLQQAIDPFAKASKDDKALEVAQAALESLTLFHTSAGEPYACVPMGDHVEVLAVEGKTFKQWFARWWYMQSGEALGEGTNLTLQTLLAGRALYDGEEAEVYNRIAYDASRNTIYVNLANERNEIVEIDANGWRVVQQAPVYFRKTKGMHPLPRPARGGSLNELRPLVNLPSDEMWRLTMAWLVGCFHPTGPYAILGIHGEEGSAKSSLMHYLCELVDPTVVDKRSAPRNEQDLAIAAKGRWVMTLENVSTMPLWLSDSLCRLATGGGLTTRKLFTDDEEAMFFARRPIVMNGIPTVATKGDLLSRLLMVSLPTIQERQRRSERSIEAAFRECQPRLLGALYDAVSVGLREWPHVKLETLPRMADFAEWVVACEDAFGWAPGAFMRLFADNQAENVTTQLEASIVAREVLRFMKSKHEWTGLTTDLDQQLRSGVFMDRKAEAQWPANANKLGEELTRLARSLRQAGIEVEKRRSNRGSRWTLRRVRDVDDAGEDMPTGEANDAAEDDLDEAALPSIDDSEWSVTESRETGERRMPFLNMIVTD